MSWGGRKEIFSLKLSLLESRHQDSEINFFRQENKKTRQLSMTRNIQSSDSRHSLVRTCGNEQWADKINCLYFCSIIRTVFFPCNLAFSSFPLLTELNKFSSSFNAFGNVFCARLSCIMRKFFVSSWCQILKLKEKNASWITICRSNDMFAVVANKMTAWRSHGKDHPMAKQHN